MSYEFEFEDFDDDPYEARSCFECGGSGYVVRCIDDLSTGKMSACMAILPSGAECAMRTGGKKIPICKI